MSRRHVLRAARVAPVVVPLALAGCVRGRPALAAEPAREYRGHYTSGPGASWFRPCGAARADSAWWVTLEGRTAPQLDSARAARGAGPGAPVYVRWRAARADGSDVELGPRPGAPALSVREVLEVRPAAAGDCVAPA